MPAARRDDDLERPSDLLPASRYEPPERPAQSSLKRMLAYSRRMLTDGETEPEVAFDRLDATGTRRRARLAPDDAAGPWRDTITTALDSVAASDDATRHHHVILLPTGCPDGLLESWGERRDHRSLVPVSRRALLEAARVGTPVDSDLPPDDGSMLVIGDLARWCVRQHTCLDGLRSFLTRLSHRRSPLVIGCNPFVWRWLDAVLGAGRLLPEPSLPAPCDAAALARWFAAVESARSVRFRNLRSGNDVLATDDDGTVSDDFLHELAARSLGIPWIAWHLWQAAMREAAEPDDVPEDTETDSDERTVWLSQPPATALEAARRSEARLVFHSVLLHGRIDRDMLALTLPLTRTAPMVAMLVADGLLVPIGDELACSPNAYPRVRAELQDAGIACGPC